ncbi:hypothetical protein EV426DRAFT_324428 [Tirmania nivea]|nr:hypothetical protein EV426DRAFT_324428 [Tirmania nivea]
MLVYTIPLASSSRILALCYLSKLGDATKMSEKHTPEGLGNYAPPQEYPQCCLPRGRESRPNKGMSTLYHNLQSAEGTIPRITSGWNINHETPFHRFRRTINNRITKDNIPNELEILWTQMRTTGNVKRGEPSTLSSRRPDSSRATSLILHSRLLSIFLNTTICVAFDISGN